MKGQEEERLVFADQVTAQSKGHPKIQENGKESKIIGKGVVNGWIEGRKMIITKMKEVYHIEKEANNIDNNPHRGMGGIINKIIMKINTEGALHNLLHLNIIRINNKPLIQISNKIKTIMIIIIFNNNQFNFNRIKKDIPKLLTSNCLQEKKDRNQ